MNQKKTADWLTETQNKSWEPEILISGFTLTFLFILSNYIYNFCGMLIQDFAVFEVIGKILYYIFIGILTGFKIVLIIHLILRGFWTGLIGLSYVYPHGVNKKNMKRNIDFEFDPPEVYIIKFEKICSLLFSIVFTSIIFVSGFFVVFIPTILLFLIGIDIQYISFFVLYIVVPLAVLSGIIASLLNKRISKLRIYNVFLEKGIFNYLLTVFLSNIGILKTTFMFVVMFVIILTVSFSDMAKFDFKNRRTVENEEQAGIISLKKDHYESLRDHDLRIPKATINDFKIHENSLNLFISYYKEDIYTLKKYDTNPELFSQFNLDSNITELKMNDIYELKIDNQKIGKLSWFMINNEYTDQKGLITEIPLDSLQAGLHKLIINKIYWNVRKREVQFLENWEIIPFEKYNYIH